MEFPTSGSLPRLTTVCRLVKNTTSNGTIIVARNTTNRVRRNGNCKKANAYPAQIDVKSCPPTMRNVTTALLNRYEETCPALQASEYTLHFGRVGKSVGGRAVIFSGVSSELTIVMYIGNSTISASTLSKM